MGLNPGIDKEGNLIKPKPFSFVGLLPQKYEIKMPLYVNILTLLDSGQKLGLQKPFLTGHFGQSQLWDF